MSPPQHYFKIVVIILATLRQLVKNGEGRWEDGLMVLAANRPPISLSKCRAMSPMYGWSFRNCSRVAGGGAFLYILFRPVNARRGQATIFSPIPVDQQFQRTVGQ